MKYSLLKVIEDYLSIVKELNPILDILVRPYFSKICKEGLGCCIEDFYSFDVPEELLEIQEKEARSNGWEKREKGCKYHSNKGCKIPNSMSPLCITSICPSIGKGLEKEFGQEGKNLANLLEEASRKGSLAKDPKGLFAYLENIITAGNLLLKKSQKGENK